MKPIFFFFQFTPYVILFIERDGSTYLSSLLSSHPDVDAIYERFAVLKQKGQGGAEQLDWARTFWTPSLINPVSARGFKTKLIDIQDQDGFTNLLREKKVKIIHMQRQNRVKAVISKINARRLYNESGYWNLYKEADRMPPMDINPQQFRELLVEREQLEYELSEYVKSLNLPTLPVNYEDLMANLEPTLRSIFDFLRIKPKPVESKTIKHTSDDLRDVVMNFDQLRDQYRDTSYLAMFDEVRS